MSEIWPGGDHQYSNNLGLALWGADPVVIENFLTIDAAFGSISSAIDINGVAVPNPNFVDSASVTFTVVGSNVHATAAGGGSSVDVNGNPIANPNFNGTTPAAPAGNTNVTFQVSGGSVSAYVPSIPQLAVTKAAVTSNFLTSYTSTTGVFTASQPTFSDLSAHPTTLSGYGITDALPSSTQLAVTKAAVTSNFLTSYTSTSGAFTAAQPTFTDLAAHPTTLAGYGITDANKWASLTGDLTETQVIPWDGATPGTKTTGISRIADGTLAIGNGSAGDYSGSLKLIDLILSGTKNTTIASGATGADWTLTLPTTQGTNLYVLQTDGSGNTSWVAQTPSGAGVYLPLAGGTMTGVLTLEASAAGLKDATGSAGVNGNVLTINGSGYPVWAAPAAAAWASLTGDLTETQVIPFDGGTPGTKDTIISRSAPGTVAIGTTGTAGDYSGSLTLQSENIIGTGTSTTNGMLVLSNPTATAIGTLQQIEVASSTSILIFAENYYYNGSSLVRTDTSKGGVRFQMNATSTNSGNVYTITIGDTSGNDNVAIQQQLNGSAKAVTQFIAPIISTGVLGFDSGSAADTGISRTAVGVLAIGNGSNGNASGQIACAVLRNTGFTVANLPSTAAAGKVEGATAYATNGLKPTETTGNGTGVPVFYSAAGPAGAGWYSYPGLALVAS